MHRRQPRTPISPDSHHRIMTSLAPQGALRTHQYRTINIQTHAFMEYKGGQPCPIQILLKKVVLGTFSGLTRCPHTNVLCMMYVRKTNSLHKKQAKSKKSKRVERITFPKQVVLFDFLLCCLPQAEKARKARISKHRIFLMRRRGLGWPRNPTCRTTASVAQSR